MKTKEFALSLLSGCRELQDVRKDLLKSIGELSLVYKAAIICRDVQELQEFIKNI